MSSLSDDQRAGRLSEQDVIAIQLWLWHLAEQGWKPFETDIERWSHEDNQAATKLGWMIVELPNQAGRLDLFSLKPGRTPKQIMETIVAAAPLDPLCARAVAVLTQQRFRFPNATFSYEKDIKR